jgi:hypothetical protein
MLNDLILIKGEMVNMQDEKNRKKRNKSSKNTSNNMQ